MTMRSTLNKIYNKVVTIIKGWFLPKPALVLLPASLLGYLSSTFFVVAAQNLITKQWFCLLIHTAHNIHVRHSHIGDFLNLKSPKVSQFLWNKNLFLPTGVYVPLPMYLRMLDLKIITVQLPNTILTTEVVESIVPQILESLNQDVEVTTGQEEKLHFTMDDLALPRTLN